VKAFQRDLSGYDTVFGHADTLPPGSDRPENCVVAADITLISLPFTNV